jgi:hypothetical protein
MMVTTSIIQVVTRQMVLRSTIYSPFSNYIKGADSAEREPVT